MGEWPHICFTQGLNLILVFFLEYFFNEVLQVASGVGRLVSSAEKASGGNLEEEELVANAKHVAVCDRE